LFSVTRNPLQFKGGDLQLAGMYWIALFSAILAGACISVQAAANASLRTYLNDARWATFFSICGTIVTAVIVMLAIRPAAPSVAAMRAAPWWNWIGGPLGAVIVLAGAALSPRLGAAAFIAAVVAGQLASSIALDHFAWMNLPHQPISLSRGIGVVLVFVGVLLVTRRP
jgi:bacterial/archaeal transporter family-2 protein